MLTFKHVRSIPLFYDAWCGLLGVDAELNIYAEEIYEDTWAAQYKFSFTGELLQRLDEERGQNPGYTRLELPPGTVTPHSALAATALNFGGGRWHGNLEADRVRDLARPLTPADRQWLVAAGLQRVEMLPYIVGIVDSYVSSEAEVRPNQFVICRRLRLAYVSVPETHRPAPGSHIGDAENYDSVELALLQQFDPADAERPLHESWLGPNTLGITPNWPVDVVTRDGYLFLADVALPLSPGSYLDPSPQRQVRGPSRIHILRIEP